MLEGPKIVENLFFAVTCISIFTCTIRADYNFAMGLLCYYLIKNANGTKVRDAAKTVSLLKHNLVSVNFLECVDHCHGCLVVRNYELCLGWEASEEPPKLASIRQNSWLHYVPQLRKCLPQGCRSFVPIEDLERWTAELSHRHWTLLSSSQH